jgi:hypothetical protein
MVSTVAWHVQRTLSIRIWLCCDRIGVCSSHMALLSAQTHAATPPATELPPQVKPRADRFPFAQRVIPKRG